MSAQEKIAWHMILWMLLVWSCLPTIGALIAGRDESDVANNATFSMLGGAVFIGGYLLILFFRLAYLAGAKKRG